MARNLSRHEIAPLRFHCARPPRRPPFDRARRSRTSTAGRPRASTRCRIGDPAPDFSLLGIDGRTYSLADFRDSPFLMVVFLSNHCPASHAAETRFIPFVASLKGKGVAVVAINPNSLEGLRIDELGYSKYSDSYDDMKLYAQGAGLQLPVPLRRRHPGDGDGVRLPVHAPPLHLRPAAAACATRGASTTRRRPTPPRCTRRTAPTPWRRSSPAGPCRWRSRGPSAARRSG